MCANFKLNALFSRLHVSSSADFAIVSDMPWQAAVHQTQMHFRDDARALALSARALLNKEASNQRRRSARSYSRASQMRARARKP